MHGVAAGFGDGVDDIFKIGPGNLGRLSALAAYQMGGSVAAVMFIPAASVTGIVRRDQSESFQKIQGSIDCRYVGLGIGFTNGTENLVRRDRMAELVHCIEDQSALAGHPESTVTHRSLEQFMTRHSSPYCNILQ